MVTSYPPPSKVWTIEPQEMRRTRIGLSLSHDDCSMMALSKRLKTLLDVRMTSDALRDGRINCSFGVSELVPKEELPSIFEGLIGSVSSAKIYYLASDDREYTGFEILYTDEPVSSILSLDGCSVEEYRVSPDKESLLVDLQGTNPLGQLLKVADPISDLEIQSVQRLNPFDTAHPRPLLTEDEAHKLQHMIDQGLFDIPRRRTTLQKIAGDFNISDSQLSLELRRMTSKLFSEYLKKAVRTTVF